MYGAERTEVLGKRVRNVKPYDDSNGWNENNTSGEFEYKAPSTEQAKQWDGWGSALKPANEPIVLARKPLEKGLSIAENVLKWGTGGINIDGCRIGFNEYDKGEYINKRVGYKDGFDHKQLNGKDETFGYKLDNNEGERTKIFDNKGRFPANIILTHHPECECVGTKKVKGTSGNLSEGEDRETKFGQVKSNKVTTHYGSEETIEDWNCHEDCPIKILDEQSGVSKSSGGNSGVLSNSVYGKYATEKNNEGTGFGDKGGASRFFYVAKASKSERNKGLEGFEEKKSRKWVGGMELTGSGNKRIEIDRNIHPTVKPIKLMQYLVRLITPPNGIVLDPFCGSGTTGVACKLEGFNFIGLEQDAEYCKIAQARIDNYEEESVSKKKYNNSDEKTNDNQLNLF
jgi:site-specific DNA-methyltransferase (adenine-specific)